MTCDKNCQVCSVSGGDFIVDQSTLNYPSTANPGDTVNVTFNVKFNCTGPLCEQECIVCLHDTISGKCEISAGPIYFTGSSGTSISTRVSYIQPTTDYYGTISVLGINTILGTGYCTDSVTFKVASTTPVGQGWSCDQTSHSCYPDPNSTITHDQCVVSCGGTPSGGGGFGQCVPACSSSDMCVMGMCVPKPLVLVGVAALLIMLMGRGGGK